MHKRGTNPIVNGPMPRYHEASELRTDRDSDMVSRQWARNKVVSRQTEDIVRSVRTLQRQLDMLRMYFGRGGAAAGTGWKFKGEYDPAVGYKKNHVVIVSPENTAHTAGVDNNLPLAGGGGIVGQDGYGPHADRATAGMFLCVQAPRVLHPTQPTDPDDPPNYNVHVPIWPLPDKVVAHTDNFWMLIGFYPIEMDICINGASTPHYVQAHPIPDEFMLGEGGGEGLTGEGGESFVTESPS